MGQSGNPSIDIWDLPDSSIRDFERWNSASEQRKQLILAGYDVNHGQRRGAKFFGQDLFQDRKQPRDVSESDFASGKGRAGTDSPLLDPIQQNGHVKQGFRGDVRPVEREWPARQISAGDDALYDAIMFAPHFTRCPFPGAASVAEVKWERALGRVAFMQRRHAALFFAGRRLDSEGVALATGQCHSKKSQAHCGECLLGSFRSHECAQQPIAELSTGRGERAAHQRHVVSAV